MPFKAVFCQLTFLHTLLIHKGFIHVMILALVTIIISDLAVANKTALQILDYMPNTPHNMQYYSKMYTFNHLWIPVHTLL